MSAVVKHRLPFMILAMLNLLAGLCAGLARIGWSFHVNKLAPAHGAIMVGGFLGTLIILEKLIPLKRKVLFIVPILSASSVILFFFGLQKEAIVILTLSSLCLAGIFAFYLFTHKDLQYLIMLAGAVCWLIGNVLLYTQNFYPLSLPMWIGFILLIIVGERIELMKFLPVSINEKRLLLALLVLYLVSTLFSFHGSGNTIAGISLIGIAIWLLKYDVVGIGIAKSHLTKYVAMALMCGYVSMLVCGIFLMTTQDSAMSYDIVVHTFFLGFAFSMIFAHGPIILPGVLGISIKPYHKIFYVFLALLHSSWLVRTFADVTLDFQLRKVSGLLSTLAILGYFISLVTVSITQLRGKTV